jgi:hypothetical protein
MTRIQQHREIPPAVSIPVQHNSGSMRSTPAGGEVPRDQYQRPTPAPAPSTKIEKEN